MNEKHEMVAYLTFTARIVLKPEDIGLQRVPDTTDWQHNDWVLFDNLVNDFAEKRFDREEWIRDHAGELVYSEVESAIEEKA